MERIDYKLVSVYNLEAQTTQAWREDIKFPAVVKPVPTYIDLLFTGAVEQCQHKRVRDETREQTDFEGKIIGSWDA